MNDIILKIILSVISLIGLIITGVVVPYVKSKLNTEQLNSLQTWIEIAIYAAEQKFKEKSQGKEKKLYVYEYIKKQFPKLSYEDFEILLEGTGKALNIFN